MSKLALKLIQEAKEKGLTFLDLGNCGLIEIPKEVFELERLEELNLGWYYLDQQTQQFQETQNKEARNSIRHLSRKIKSLVNLKALYLSDNKIEDISPLEQLPSLYLLHLHNNRIKDIKFLNASPSLSILYLSNNLIEDVRSLMELNSLSKLYLSSNKIKDISPLKALTFLSTLQLHDNHIIDIRSLEKLTSLTSLNLSGNYITDIKPVKELNALLNLSISRNHVTDISPLKELTLLSELSFSGNKVTDISSLENLTSLTKLSFPRNQVSDVKPLKELVSLSKLYLSGNQITDISPLKELKSLYKLDLSYNQITDISPLKNTIKREIPVKWKNDHSDKGIVLEGNPLTTPPPEIVQQGNEAVLNYFKQLEQQGPEYLYEAKLLIIGEGGTGKTTLARKLKNEAAPMPEEKDSTKGIAIEHYHFTTANGTNFQINIWDFGGQEIYHATHQFFLTKRSLYVLVDDTRKDDKSVNDPIFNYWLQVAGLYGGGSPLLIVQNEKSGRTKELDMKGMIGHFDFIKEGISIDLSKVEKSGDLDKMKDIIHFYIRQLPHVGEKLPKKWVMVRKELEEQAKSKNYITLEEYLSICTNHDIKEEEKALLLSSYLHDLGSVLHFQNDFNLRNIFILNNQWATDAVYKVLDNELVKSKYGHFGKNDLSEIWSDAKYRFRQQELLNLMIKFELCYELNERSESNWIAPQLLPVKAPSIIDNWDYNDNLTIRYTYDFMPKGLLSRFIVHMHKYITEPSLSWRSGVVLERQNTTSLITETYGGREIVIRVKGFHSKELMTLIAEDFDNMHGQFENFKVKKLIPCNCSKCRALKEPNFYEFDDLKTRREKGKRTVECKISYDDVDVNGLLDGVFVLKESIKENRAFKAFISYSHKDTEYKEEFKHAISPLVRREKIVLWDDGCIAAGKRWNEEIFQHLSGSDIVFLLISHDFVACDFCYGKELKSALEAYEKKEKIIIGIRIRETHLEGLPISEIQCLPNKWLNNIHDDAAWAEIAREIERSLEEFKKEKWI